MPIKKWIYLSFLILIIAAGVAVTWYYFARKQEKSKGITLFGNVDVRQVEINFRIAGRVVAMLFQEGDFVPKGALMTTIEEEPYADKVQEAEALVASTKISLSNAEAIFQRREELIENGGVSWEDYDNAKTARDVLASNLNLAKAALGVAEKNLKDTSVYCPNDGVILTRVREPGTVVQPSDPVYTLSLLSPVWIRAFVPEPLLGKIYYGMEAEVYTDSGQIYKGHIGFISPVAEFTPKTVQTEELRTDLVYRLRIIADNPDRYLKQGMPVTVKLWPS